MPFLNANITRIILICTFAVHPQKVPQASQKTQTQARPRKVGRVGVQGGKIHQHLTCC